MTTKTIRVIKREERQQQQHEANNVQQSEEPQKSKGNRAAAREMVANVSTWVNEFQHKRRTETKRAFESLFADTTPQPNEV